MASVGAEELQGSPLFSALNRKELRRLGEVVTRRTFPAGASAAAEGEVGVGFFVIESGEARVTVGERMAWTLGPGDHFGEIALILERPRTLTVIAETELRCFAMTSWEFRRLVESNASVAWRVLEAMARRVMKLEEVMLAQPKE